MHRDLKKMCIDTFESGMTRTHEKCNPFIMLSKTHIVAQKPRGRQLAKYKVCESAIFVLSSDHFVQQQ